jgi:hypothetical protein
MNGQVRMIGMGGWPQFSLYMNAKRIRAGFLTHFPELFAIWPRRNRVFHRLAYGQENRSGFHFSMDIAQTARYDFFTHYRKLVHSAIFSYLTGSKLR